MKYAWIEQHRTTYYVEIMCRVLGVKRSSFTSWQRTDSTERDKRRQQDQDWVRRVFYELKENAGTRMIKGHLDKEYGIVMSRRKIGRIMDNLELAVKTKRKFKKSDTAPASSALIAPNRLNRQFDVRYMNQAWVGDITQIQTRQGWQYLAVFIDLYSRKVVGWHMDKHMRSELVETALKRALWSRRPPKGLIVHTDQGSQFISKRYRKLLSHWGLKQSMSRRGNCWDNAVVESFFKTLKAETVYQLGKQIKASPMRWLISDYMGYYNHVRPHSNNGYLAPNRFEALRRAHLEKLERNLGTKYC